MLDRIKSDLRDIQKNFLYGGLTILAAGCLLGFILGAIF